MKSTELKHHLAGRMNRMMKLPLLCGLMASFSTAGLMAGNFAGDTYLNQAIVSYPGTEPQPPMIAATNFVNENQFIINYTAGLPSYSYYESWNTENHVNSGLMMGNTGFFFRNRSTVSGAVAPSASFFNSGTISCGSIDDITAPFFPLPGQCFVSATNIVSPGQIIAGSGGRVFLSGDYLDLSYSTIRTETAPGGASGTGVFGFNPFFWNPSASLTSLTATSAPVQLSLFNFGTLALSNSTAFMRVRSSGPNNALIQAVFIQDTSGSDVSYNVYNFHGFTGSDATIEWVGKYLDPATGQTYTNYLYMTNDFVLTGTTNNFLLNNIPANFRFGSSTNAVPQGILPSAPAFLGNFPNFVSSNGYGYANAQLIATSVGTNTVVNLSMTNMPGRIEISASRQLNLSNADITGINYLSLQSPHQFDGSTDSKIEAPYSDISIGVTNGFLNVTNLISPFLRTWSGTVQAWSTTWNEVILGFTNTYQVLLVGSQLNPISPAVVQDLKLHGTNSVVISDKMNVVRSILVDAQNLTLTTNETGVGATSFAGELNVATVDVFWHKSLPNLRNLTNNGSIRLQNLAQFNGTYNSYSITPGSPAVAARGHLSAFSAGVNLAAGNTVTIGTNRYLFVKKITNSVPNQIKLGTKLSSSLSNLVLAINGSAGAGSNYSSSTLPNVFVSAGPVLSNRFVTVTARVPGTGANGVLTTNRAPNLTWNGHLTLYGGINAVAAVTNVTGTPVAYHSMVNSGLISDQGSTVNADYFQSSGTISNWLGSFVLQSKDTLLTNGSITAGGDISITTGTLVTSNVLMTAGRSLVLRATNYITDTGVTNGNYWVVGGGSGVGLNLTIRPTGGGDLLGTTVSNVAPANKVVSNTWPGRDLGVTPAGYTNNQSLGRLILNGQGTLPLGGNFYFTGVTASNALYVDTLEFIGSMTNRDAFGNVTALSINTNLVIYYAQALQSGVSVAQKINHKNGDRLRWVSDYVGYFSSTNLVYPPDITNAVNTALLQSSTIDSDGDGVVNALDSTPMFVPQQVNLTLSVTNVPPLSVRVSWDTIPNATNYVCFSTNMVGGPWFPLTNYTGYYFGSGQFVTNSSQRNWFVSPQNYPGPITNVWIFDPIGGSSRYYKVAVHPWSTYPF